MHKAIWLAALLAVSCGTPPAPTSDCSKDNGGCDANATCAMVDGLPVCECRAGFAGDGIKACDEMLVLTAPAEGVVYNKETASFTLSGNIKKVTALEYKIDGGAPQPLSVTSASFTTSIPLANDDGVQHTIEVTATGDGERRSKATRKYTVDRVPPVVTIETPDHDGACEATGCTGAVVNASTSGLAFSGKAQDGSGLAAAGLVATIDGEPLTATATGAQWSASWTGIPDDDGKEHVFTITAADAVGNKTEVSRTVIVDRVAPTCTVPQGKRLLERTATLVKCSERMDVASVRTAVTFNGAAIAGLDSADGKSFQFQDGTALGAYEVYSIDLKAGVQDLAGNESVASVAGKFLTELALPPAQAPINLGGEGIQSSNQLGFAVDTDGRPSVVAITGSSATGFRATAFRWDGESKWLKSAPPFTTPACPTPSEPWKCPHFELFGYQVNSTVGADLLLSVEYELLMGKKTTNDEGHTLTYVHSSNFMMWTGRSSEYIDPDVLFGPTTGYQSMLYSFIREYSGASVTTAVLSQLVTTNAGSNFYQIGIRRSHASGWSDVTGLGGLQTTPFDTIKGNGAINKSKIHLMPSAIVLPFNGSEIFNSADQWRSANLTPTGSAMLIWANPTKVSSTVTYPSVFLACSAIPDSPSSWKASADLTPLPATSRNNFEPPVGVAIALNENKVAVALETMPWGANNTLYFGTLDNSDCTAEPGGIQWETPVPDAYAPKVAVSPTGTVWHAWIDATKNLVITH